MSYEEHDIPEDHVSFVGPCTCARDKDDDPIHTPEEHGWGSCGVDECECEAGWEE